jgi:hypothetical protein
MIFNVTTKKVFKCIKHDQAIKCGKGRGPCFGGGELAAFEPFNGDSKCESWANNPGYNIGKDSESRSMLTNLKCVEYRLSWAWFTISELEVWEVTFEK